MHRAGTGGDQQHAAMVFVQQTGDPAGLQIPHRVAAETRHAFQFIAPGHHLQEQGVSGVARDHLGGITVRYSDGEVAAGRIAAGKLPCIQCQPLQQLQGVVDCLCQLLLPAGFRQHV